MDATIGKFIDCSKSEWTPEWKSPEPKDQYDCRHTLQKLIY